MTRLAMSPLFWLALGGCDPLEYDSRLDALEQDVADLQETTGPTDRSSLEDQLAALRTALPIAESFTYTNDDRLIFDSVQRKVFDTIRYEPPGPGVLIATLDTVVTFDNDSTYVAVGLGTGDEFASATSVGAFRISETDVSYGEAVSVTHVFRTEGEPLEVQILAECNYYACSYDDAQMSGLSTRLTTLFVPDPPTL